MSNDLGQREVCAVTALGHGDDLDVFKPHRTRRVLEIEEIDRKHNKESEDMKIMV